MDHVDLVTSALAGVIEVRDRLVLTDQPRQPCIWAENIWLNPKTIEIDSIADAARKLRGIQRNWCAYASQLHRRTSLITAQLPKLDEKSRPFPSPLRTEPLGSFTLLSQNVILASAKCTSPFPNGDPEFKEFKPPEGPESRAYLKLFEALTLLGHHPQTRERCLDLGASPGGWTWVLARLGAQVTAVDRAPLARNIASLPNVKTVEGDAFAATPDQIGAIDWLFSDVICYPEKLFEFVQLWLNSGKCSRFVCTLKFQGTDHYGIINEFTKIPGSRLVHLHHNKHELTWMKV